MHYVNVKGILSAKNGMNLYRGCSHGCIYCDSRSKCYHMEHAFEDIEVKANAIELLEYSLSHKRKKVHDWQRLHDGPVHSVGNRASECEKSATAYR